jgi:hypothetical protein
VGKTLTTRAKEIGLTEENGIILGTCVGGLVAFGAVMSLFDEASRYLTTSEASYKGYARFFYGSPLGKLASAGGLLFAINEAQGIAIDQKYLSKNASRKAKAAGLAFTGAGLLSRIDAYSIGKRFEYLTTGSATAALSPTGPDAALINQALMN